MDKLSQAKLDRKANYEAQKVEIWTTKIMGWLNDRRDSIPMGQGEEFYSKIKSLPKDSNRETVRAIVVEHLKEKKDERQGEER